MSTLQELRNALNIKEKNGKRILKHNINKRVQLLPFQTRNPERAKFKNGFQPVLGQFFRNIEKVKYDLEMDKEEIIRNMVSEVQLDKQDQKHLERILEDYLFKGNSIRLFHPIMFKYIPLTNTKELQGEEEIAQYIYDALLNRDSSKFEEILKLQDNDHVLARLIHDQMPKLAKNENNKKFNPTLPFIQELFQKDLETLLSNRDFFMNHINLFLAYYYFYSITQLTLKMNKFEEMDVTSTTPIYYNLDWESTNRNRQAVTTGFKIITDNARKLLDHANTLEHLNFILDTENLSYPELVERFEKLDSDEQAKILNDLYDWTLEYTEIVLGNQNEIEKKNTLPEAYRQLHQQLTRGLSKETKYRYALAINEIGRVYFLKTRGSLGNTLNVTQDFLILLTALAVNKEEKISLKQLFVEYEKRGVFFDRYSKEEIIELFNKLNLIEKKSDSGDAQYVKRIL
ncbi:DNA phosphorothioation-dependent restriction protein DptG [Salirhabdus sp. Marseille-P4669]|uniref:DNA phosphorothioation-dependent restriction protein DptG n=1 Tax=Salirhabdus sp. Marseille-P4669 TaxID=2042310 RepID=UPI000C7E576F|nr:DNA phosphorothioation-dependent restriction protein DptG [Salirhabdus sp. Marseille-P4669]